MRDVSPILRSIGLTDSEINTYLAALEGGPQTVIDITKRTNLSRQAVYIAIESLTKRGLMTSILRGKKKFFAAESPETLLAYARRKETELKTDLNKLEEALPDLRLASGGEKPTVKTYEGKEGILAMITELQASQAKNIFEITDVETMYRILTPEELKPLREKVVKKGVKIFGIYSGYTPPLEEKSPVTNKEVCMLPSRFSRFNTNITIFENKTALVSFEGKMHSVIIESRALSNTFRILLELAMTGCRAEKNEEWTDKK
ncbi:MAG: helix-turn-helix domain-containing protein [Patescibacteria group bacterium]